MTQELDPIDCSYLNFISDEDLRREHLTRSDSPHPINRALLPHIEAEMRRRPDIVPYHAGSEVTQEAHIADLNQILADSRSDL